MIISIKEYLILSLLLFVMGIVGVTSRKNIFTLYMSIELMLNAAALGMIALSRHYENLDASVISLLIVALAAAEAALFLTVIILLFRKKESLNIDIFNFLRRR